MQHTKRNDSGGSVIIRSPDKDSPRQNWMSSSLMATVTPNGETPPIIGGVSFTTSMSYNGGRSGNFKEPKMPEDRFLSPASGCIILERDRRVWVVHPTNQFGGYKATFPKGKLESGLTPKLNAIKEAFEESGLVVELIDYAADVARTTSITRYYFARRIGGNPLDMGWESQAVSLVPRNMLSTVVNNSYDKPLIDAIMKRP